MTINKIELENELIKAFSNSGVDYNSSVIEAICNYIITSGCSKISNGELKEINSKFVTEHLNCMGYDKVATEFPSNEIYSSSENLRDLVFNNESNSDKCESSQDEGLVITTNSPMYKNVNRSEETVSNISVQGNNSICLNINNKASKVIRITIDVE